jgi:hypothetical protein
MENEKSNWSYIIHWWGRSTIYTQGGHSSKCFFNIWTLTTCMLRISKTSRNTRSHRNLNRSSRRRYLSKMKMEFSRLKIIKLKRSSKSLSGQTMGIKTRLSHATASTCGATTYTAHIYSQCLMLYNIKVWHPTSNRWGGPDHFRLCCSSKRRFS